MLFRSMLFAGVSLELRAGQAALLRGPNGTGKSSLMRLIAGLLPAYAGTVERNARMAMSDENLALEPNQPLAQALGFWASLDNAPPHAMPDALAALSLGHLAQVPVRILSTGQRKRAMLARVIASGSPLWLLDEPGNGLDTASLDLLGAEMQTHLASGGAIVAASHQPLPLPGATEIDISAHQPAPEAFDAPVEDAA